MKRAQSPEEKVRHLTTAPIPQLVGELSLPTIISMLVTSFYNMADTFFVGRINTQSTAAVGVAFSAMAFIQAVSFFFGHGSGNYISRCLGAKCYEDAERMAATGFFSSLGIGVVIAVLGNVFIVPLSRMLIGITAGAVLNVVLDPVLIFGFRMGVAGAAWATSFSQMVSFILLCVLSARTPIHVRVKRFTPSAHYFSNIFRGGIPSLCRQGIGSVAAVALNVAAGAYGGASADAAIAAMGVVNRVTAFANSALIGFGQGFQPICGTNYGAGKYSRVREAFFYCLKLGAAVLAVFAVVGIVFAQPIMHLFRDDPAVVEIGALALRAQCLTFVLNVWVILCNMMLQTVGMAFKASVVALARQGLFFLPAVALLPLIFGLFGVQTAQTAADFLAFALALPMGLSVLNKFREDAPETK